MSWGRLLPASPRPWAALSSLSGHFPACTPGRTLDPSFIPSRSGIFQDSIRAASFNRFQGIPKMGTPTTQDASCPTPQPLVCYPSWNSAILGGLEGTGDMEVSCRSNAPISSPPMPGAERPHLAISAMRTAAWAELGLGKQAQTCQGAEA